MLTPRFIRCRIEDNHFTRVLRKGVDFDFEALLPHGVLGYHGIKVALLPHYVLRYRGIMVALLPHDLRVSWCLCYLMMS